MDKGYLVQLDGLRFLAVSGVMIGHWYMTSENLLVLGPYLASAGVNLFFVLSGFLICRILISNQDSEQGHLHTLKVFYARRFLRIFPLYYGVLFWCLVFAVPFARQYFISLVTYTANYQVGLTKGWLASMTHLWSLCVEEQFYLVTPFLILFFSRKYHLALFGSLIAISLVFKLGCLLLIADQELAGWITYSFTPGCIDAFAMGGILAYLSLYDQRRLSTILTKYWWVFVALGIANVVIHFGDFGWLSMVLGRTTISIFFFWVIGLASMNLLARPVSSFLGFGPVRYLGKISYGIYVFHHFMAWSFSQFGLPASPLYYLVCTLALSMVSWHLFESPINGLKKYFSYGGLNSKPRAIILEANTQSGEIAKTSDDPRL
jgi:peptidoglycan/LPS O-acetylase OafA/YrhL